MGTDTRPGVDSIIAKLIAGGALADVNAIDAHTGSSALYFAALFGADGPVSKLLEAKLDDSDDIDTVLHSAHR